MAIALRPPVIRAVVWIGGAVVFAIGFARVFRMSAIDPTFADWSFYWAGGATAGTRALLDPRLHVAFEVSHGLKSGIWPYLPGFSWLFVPATHFTLGQSYALNAIAMFVAAAIAGIILAYAFALPWWLGAIMGLAWPPVKIAAMFGQNTPLALVLIAVAIVAARRNWPLVLGIAVGALLYKPTIGLPFTVVLFIRRDWRALAVVIACAACWYLLSVAATGGDWAWPKPYGDAVHAYYGPDFWSDPSGTVSLPGLLMRLGIPTPVAIGIGVLLFALSLPRLAKLGAAESLSVTSILAVALSPHAWPYETVIALPAIMYALKALSQPLATVLVTAAYLTADGAIFGMQQLSWNLLIVVVLFWAALLMFTAGADAPMRRP